MELFSNLGGTVGILLFVVVLIGLSQMAVLTASGGQVMPGPRRVWTDFMCGVSVSGRLGTACTGTTGDVNLLIAGGYGIVPAVAFEWHVKGTQTILAPVMAAAGLDIASQDQTADDGIELTNGILYRSGSPKSFKVGTDPAFYFKCKFSIVDVSGTDDCAVGFRKAEAYQAAIDNYDEGAFLNVIAGNINIETILNNAATTTTDTTDNWADGETHTLGVYVSGAGVVTYTIDGSAPTVTASFTFDDGEEVIPFFYFLQDTDIAGVVAISEWDCGLQ